MLDLYRDHLRALDRGVASALAGSGLDGLVLHSGTPLRYHADDQDAPFRPTPHFARFVPMGGPGHLLLARPGRRPLLVRLAPEDYWYEQAPLGQPFWAGEFDLTEVGDPGRTFAGLPKGRFAFVGDCPAEAQARGFAATDVNPGWLLARLDWDRSFKTDYEIACLAEASALGARAHRAARAAFVAGASELEIHQRYLAALEATEEDLPYGNIIALDDKGAILHYLGKRRQRGGRVLLIDCGAKVRGYACDITRTWVSDGCDPLFRELLDRFDALQQSLCAMVRPGLPYLDLHLAAHRKVGEVLADLGLLAVSGAEAFERGLTTPFFPHGVGHFLGLQVHDVAGHQAARDGGRNPPPAAHPYLRTTRTIEPGQVFTVEPGLYFIDMLLRPFRGGPHAAAFDWARIDRLRSHGGMRIEDNVVATPDGHRNLTRLAFAA